MSTLLDADHLVVGAGAAGMAFTDALVRHSDARVVIVDRRDGVGGHWLDAYPFVRLHQASSFYGVASTLLGGGRVQTSGPEAGLHERADRDEVTAYYARVLAEVLLPTGRVSLLTRTEHLGGGRCTSLDTGRAFSLRPGARVVDARYLAPEVPAVTPPPFAVGDGARVVPVSDLPREAGSARAYAVVGAGKTATDAIVWLLGRGVDPQAIRWVRPREPWMLDRAVVQPDPAVFTGMVADVMEAAVLASSPDDLFLRLEDAGVMLRLDRSLVPTMAKAPTIGRWELDLLRTVEGVVRLGHVLRAERDRLVCAEGEVPLAPGTLVVHCASPGLRYPPLVPVWAPGAITVQPVRAGFPCFGAALVGYVEATRTDDAAKNRLCPPSPLPDTTSGWTAMQVLGGRAVRSFSAEPDILAWAGTVPLNPARVPADDAGRPEVVAALARLAAVAPAGSQALAELADLS